MNKLTVLVFCGLVVVALSVIEDKDVSPSNWGKKIGEKCDGNDSDCLCAGSWVKCRCPWKWHLDGSGQCTCEKGLSVTCESKKSCPNYPGWRKIPAYKWFEYTNDGKPMPTAREETKWREVEKADAEEERRYMCI